jgi:ornithine decarboxylase
MGFDCASTREMVLVKELLGKQPFGNKVLFANPCKTSSDISYANQNKIGWVTADSVEEFVKMNTANYKPDVLLRIAIDDTSSSCQFGAKFGLQPDEVHPIVRQATALKNSATITGLSFHVGSGSKDPSIYRKAVELSKLIWTSLQEDNLVGTFKTLDLGGGWSSDPALFKQQAFHAKEGLLFENQPEQLIAEPGRFFAAPLYDLYVQVVGKKPRAGGGWRYTIDESIYGQFSCIPFDHATPKFYRIHSEQFVGLRKKSPCSIFGRTCDSLDWIANSDSMEELNVGDWLYIPTMGAYTASTSTEFNGFPKPEWVLTDASPEAHSLSPLTGLQFPLASMLSVPY